MKKYDKIFWIGEIFVFSAMLWTFIPSPSIFGWKIVWWLLFGIPQSIIGIAMWQLSENTKKIDCENETHRNNEMR